MAHYYLKTSHTKGSAFHTVILNLIQDLALKKFV